MMKTNTINTNPNGIMERMENLNRKLQAALATFQEKVKPVAVVTTIIAAVYSAVAVIGILFSLAGSGLVDALADSPICNVIFALLFIGAMVGLVITGGILTALWLFLKAAGKIFGRGHILDVGSFIGFIISVGFNLMFSILALFLVAVALFAAPIIPILMRRKQFDA